MPKEESGWRRPDLPPGVLLPNEQVLHHWPSPGGVAVLTDQRLILAGHPHPLRRPVHSIQPLESIRAFEVAETPWSGKLAQTLGQAGGATGGGMMGEIVQRPREFWVIVDGVPVYVGYPDPCGEIQQWIDEARTARSRVVGPRADGRLPGGSDSGAR